MKNQILLLLAIVLMAGCNQKDDQAEANKIYHESQLSQDELKDFNSLSKGGVSISNISPLIIGSDGCYWVIGERKNVVTVAKFSSDNTKQQICISVRKPATMNTEANKIFHESQLSQDELKEFKYLSKGAVSISNISPLIIGSDGCYWVIGERKNVVAVAKFSSDNTKQQICIPVRKPETMNTDSASTSSQENNQTNCPAPLVSKEPCASGFEGKTIRIKTQNYANGQCHTIVSDDTSLCVAATNPK